MTKRKQGYMAEKVDADIFKPEIRIELKIKNKKQKEKHTAKEYTIYLQRFPEFVVICIVSPVTRCSTTVASNATTCRGMVRKIL